VTALYDYTQASIPLQNSIRVNGVVAIQTTNGAVLAASNFSGAFNLNIGRRSSNSVFLNARMYGFIMRGAASSAQQVADTEAYMAGKTGVVLPAALESFSNSFDQEAFA
jgi:hypothetical protein